MSQKANYFSAGIGNPLATNMLHLRTILCTLSRTSGRPHIELLGM